MAIHLDKKARHVEALPILRGVLPSDLYRLSLAYLPAEVLLKCRLVCRSWRSIVDEFYRSPGLGLSIKDRVTFGSLRHVLVTRPQREQIVNRGFVPTEDVLPYHEDGLSVIEERGEGNRLKLHLKARGTIELSYSEEFIGCYRCSDDEVITLFSDGMVFIWNIAYQVDFYPRSSFAWH